MTPTGPAPDMAHMLSGHPEQMKLPPHQEQGAVDRVEHRDQHRVRRPVGRDVRPNLTPDKTRGLGIWTSRRSSRAAHRQALGPGAADQPPMPWQGYGKMTDKDLQSVFRLPADASRR